MFDSSKSSITNSLLERALDTESLRRKIIANNIANADVPHFKRSEVDFESELQRVIEEKNSQDNRYPAKLTDPRHIPFFVERDPLEVKSRVNLDYNTTARNDGNNVDIEKETVDAAKNQMRYNAFITMLNNSYRNLKTAMRMVS